MATWVSKLDRSTDIRPVSRRSALLETLDSVVKNEPVPVSIPTRALVDPRVYLVPINMYKRVHTYIPSRLPRRLFIRLFPSSFSLRSFSPARHPFSIYRDRPDDSAAILVRESRTRSRALRAL